MKAPDVIYVEFSEDVNLAFEKQPFEETPAYIRKDALMELLLSLEARYSVFYLQGKIIRDVIDKINSL